MNRTLLTIASGILALVVTLCAAAQTPAQKSKARYPSMAPLNEYLMESNAEIALARSAAPDSISRNATVLVLGRHGYETAVKGNNGFVCGVERSWMNPFNHPDFWNPKIRGAICYNPAAARSVLPIVYLRTKMVLAGRSKAQIISGLKAAYAKGDLPKLEPAAMSYMMSKGAYLTDDGDHNVAHLMFYTPLIGGRAWGADVPKSPVYLTPAFKGAPEPIDLFMIFTGTWSDGTPAPLQ